MKLLPANKHLKFATSLRNFCQRIRVSQTLLFANLSLLAAIAVATAGLIIISGLFFGRAQIFAPQKSVGTPEPRSDALGERPADSYAVAGGRREESLLRGLPFQQALESMQAQLVQVVSPAKLGKNGILTITDSGIIKPTDHNQTQGGIGTDVSRIGKIWGTFMDLNDDVSINGKLDLSGKLTANGVVTLGNNDGDTIEVGGRFTSNLVPSKNNDIDLGTTTYRFRTGYFVNSIVVGSGTTTITDTGITTTGGSSTTITSSLLNLVSTGTLQLDTSTNNNNILLLTGTGNVGIGSTAPVYKLDVNGTLRTTGAANITGDLTLDGDLDFTGAQNITTTSDNLTLSPTGNLIIDTSGGTVSIRDAAIDLTNQSTTISGSTLTLRSTGTFILDTSANTPTLPSRPEPELSTSLQLPPD